MEQVPNQNEVESIKSEIAAMCQDDQAVRKRALENDGVIESEWDDKIDIRNTNRMKKIIEIVGWPTDYFDNFLHSVRVSNINLIVPLRLNYTIIFKGSLAHCLILLAHSRNL